MSTRVTRHELLRVVAADGVALEVHRSIDEGTPDDGPAIVVCHGFIQNRFAFEHERHSLLAFLRAQGFVLYVVELRGRAGVDTAHGLHEYTDVDAAAVIDEVARRHARAAWLGHSMGGLVGALLPAPQRDRLAAVATIGAPLFAGPASLRARIPPRRAVAAARFAHRRGFRFEGRRWSGALYAGRRVLDIPLVPAPIRIWAPGSLDDAALAFTLKRSFADDSWAVFADLLELSVTDGGRAGEVLAGSRLAALDRPLFVVAGDADDLAPPAGAKPLFERAGSRDKEYLELGHATHGVRVGHIDLLIGAAAPRLVWEPLAAFLRRTLR